jgi:tetratricopeptide (TPR) repeat protein
VAIETPYCEDEGVPASCFVGRALWSMPVAALDTPLFVTEPVQSEVLFMHPPSQATWEVALPVTPTALSFWMGLDPQAEGWWGDGVTFRLLVDDTEVFAHQLTAEPAQAGWQPASVDLSAWSGQRVNLALATDAGPLGDGAGDWAGWGDVRVVANDAEVIPEAWMRAAWAKAGITAQDLIAVGEAARQAERYEEALEWHERAMSLEPGLGDPWYYVGLVHEEQGLWGQALDAYEHATFISYFYQVHRSSVFYRIGRIYQWELKPQQLDKALAAYEAAIEVSDFNAKWEAAESHYKRGEILWQMGCAPSKYIPEYREAIRLDPNHAWAYVKLGVTYYQDSRNMNLAEDMIRQGLKLSPDHKWAYFHLGEVYYQQGRIEEATAAYERALQIDPDFEQARSKLASLDK